MTKPLLAGAALAVLVVVAPALAQSVVKPRMPKDASWVIRLPERENIVYQGVANFDRVSAGERPMSYGPGPVIALLMLAGHAAYVDTTLTQQRTAAQERADRVLLPYRAVLDRYTQRELMQRALSKSQMSGGRGLMQAGENAGADWLVEAGVVMMMTQDEKALLLDAAFAIRSSEARGQPVYERVIRVVSRPRDEDDPRIFWSRSEGERLKEESAHLVAHALDLALRDANGTLGIATAGHRTYRYREGGAEKMERAELMADLCDRIVVKNLRDWLMSIPLRPREGSKQECAAAERPAS
ncbi:MAG: hypothetical protein QOD26_4239 [Betaproteobacteria bacterium]|nr:hypothetical protein [Betaproteobacteria bacterium]